MGPWRVDRRGRDLDSSDPHTAGLHTSSGDSVEISTTGPPVLIYVLDILSRLIFAFLLVNLVWLVE